MISICCIVIIHASDAKEGREGGGAKIDSIHHKRTPDHRGRRGRRSSSHLRLFALGLLTECGQHTEMGAGRTGEKNGVASGNGNSGRLVLVVDASKEKPSIGAGTKHVI